MKLYNKLIENLSFSHQLYKLQQEINEKIDNPVQAQFKKRLGTAEQLYRSRRLSMVEYYTQIINDSHPAHTKNRLIALKAFVDAAAHSRSLDHPLNTTRVQVALIKEIVKHRHNPRKQLEAMQDFSVASFGQLPVITRLCKKLSLVLLPETGKQLCDGPSAEELHVHDSATTGRKLPSQLLIDAFIKGIARITIVHSGPHALPLMREAIEAGAILGIKVNIALEFSVRFEEHRFHFLAQLPEGLAASEIEKFFDRHSKKLKNFFAGVEETQENRAALIKTMLHEFNERYLTEINAGYPASRLYQLRPLKFRELCAQVPRTNLDRDHLLKFIWEKLKPIFANRIFYLKTMLMREQVQRREHLVETLLGQTHILKPMPESEYRLLEARYLHLRSEFAHLNLQTINDRYFPKYTITNPAFDNLATACKQLEAVGLRIKLTNSLENPVDVLLRFLDENIDYLDALEIFTLRDQPLQKMDALTKVAEWIKAYRDRGGQILVTAGSDATGNNLNLPGMGFITLDQIAKKYRNYSLKHFIKLPELVCNLIIEKASVKNAPQETIILSLGKGMGNELNRLGDDEDAKNESVSFGNFLNYLNPRIINSIYFVLGFLLAWKGIGTFYAGLWLGITGVRVAIADLLAFKGTNFRSWNLNVINSDNLARALFWTGLSVPILNSVKYYFEYHWDGILGIFHASAFSNNTTLHNMVTFFVIALANGLYISFHNKLRGFDKRIIKANFFRSIISWPFATLTGPLGKLLEIPVVVQSKIWSDTIGGIIEGSMKFSKTVGLRKHDILKLVPRILAAHSRQECYVAMLDFLYMFYREPRVRNSLRLAFQGSKYHVQDGEQLPKLEDFFQVFSSPELEHKLINYILKNYETDLAARLLKIVGESLPLFKAWCARELRGENISLSATVQQLLNETLFAKKDK